jgi:small GTP-binding protein
MFRKSLKEQEQNIPNVKVALVGDSGVGKSSIIGRYVSGMFFDNCQTTTGPSFSKKIYEKEGKSICLNLWDTVGQERFRALGKNFYKDAYIICLVFDITQKQSFENIKEVWYPDIKKHGEKYIILSIIGNKCDKVEDENVDEKEVTSFAEEIGALCFLVSALNGDKIDNLFDTLAENYLNSELKEKNDKKNSVRNRSKSFELDTESLKKSNKKKKKFC